jgi:hypothetical protein
VREKVREYLAAGTRMGVVIDPIKTNATVHTPSSPARTVDAEDILDLDPVVPGFRCRVADFLE